MAACPGGPVDHLPKRWIAGHPFDSLKHLSSNHRYKAIRHSFDVAAVAALYARPTCRLLGRSHLSMRALWHSLSLTRRLHRGITRCVCQQTNARRLTVTIKITSETVMTLSAAAKLLPKVRNGKRPHVATLYRWSGPGLRGVRLETIRIGGTTCTSVEALQRFFDASSKTAPTPRQRTDEDGRAEDELTSGGW